MKTLAIIAAICMSIYTQPATVVEVTDNIVTVEDASGNLWDVYADNYEVGQSVTMAVCDNGTEQVEDNEVIMMW